MDKSIRVGSRVETKRGNYLRVVGRLDGENVCYICETCCKRDLELWSVPLLTSHKLFYKGCNCRCDCAGRRSIKTLGQYLLIIKRNLPTGNKVTLLEPNTPNYLSKILLTNNFGLYKESIVMYEIRNPTKIGLEKRVMDKAAINNHIVCLDNKVRLMYTCLDCKDLQSLVKKVTFEQSRANYTRGSKGCFCGVPNITREEHLLLFKKEIDRLGG